MKVHEVFRSIQGEGKLAGTPMTFIRLYGCNLSCPWCDTPQDGYTEMPIEEIVDQVKDKWACITGGEPTIHAVEELADALSNAGISVAIETNGTRELSCIDFDWICVSPKSVWPDSSLLWQASELKILVGSGMYDANEILAEYDDQHHQYISLLPIWDDNYEANLKRAIELCQEYQVRLTVQVHRYLGVR